MIKGLLKVSYNLDTNENILSIAEDIKEKLSEDDLEELKAITELQISLLKKYFKGE